MALDLLEADQGMVVWWGTPLECASAVFRRERAGGLGPAESDAAIANLKALEDAWVEIQPGDALRSRATRALAVHELRAADSLQLAAALSWRPEPRQADFVTFDSRLGSAARLEGFHLLELPGPG